MKFEWKRLLPKYWYQNSPTDWEWDAILNDILDNAKEVKLSTHITEIDGVTIWTSNWPYSYGTLYYKGLYQGLPSIKTRHRLKNLVEAAHKEQLRQTIQRLRKKNAS